MEDFLAAHGAGAARRFMEYFRVIPSIRMGLAAIDTEQEGQELRIHMEHNRIMDGFNAQFIVNFLRLHPRAINKRDLPFMSRVYYVYRSSHNPCCVLCNHDNDIPYPFLGHGPLGVKSVQDCCLLSAATLSLHRWICTICSKS
jgi:hypothetical protein